MAAQCNYVTSFHATSTDMQLVEGTAQAAIRVYVKSTQSAWQLLS